jgi:hypothetical protein
VEPVPACDPTAPFGDPIPIEELNSPGIETGARLTPDELTIVFERNNEIFMAERTSTDEPFGDAEQLGLDRFGSAGAPWISDDGLLLLLEVDASDLYVSRRADLAARFVSADLFSADHSDPFVIGGANGRLYADESDDLVVAPLVDWEPGTFEPLGLSGTRPVPTRDELTLYFARSLTIVVSTRASTSDAFGSPEAVGVDVSGNGAPSWISPDGCRLYFDPWFDDLADLYVAERPPR